MSPDTLKLIKHLWGSLREQAMIDGWVHLIGIILLWVAVVWAAKKVWKKAVEDDDLMPFVLIGGFFLLVSAGLTVGFLPGIISGIINPDYWALMKLVPYQHH